MSHVVGSRVPFTRVDGTVVLAFVDRVWTRNMPTDEPPPLLNLRECETAAAHTSVPHKVSVAGASGFFYE